MNKIPSTLMYLGCIGIGVGLTVAVQNVKAPHSVPMHTQYPSLTERKILYWYDPMNPAQHFNHPGTSPSMDMPLVAQYADAGDSGMAVVPSTARLLNIRTGTVKKGLLNIAVDATGELAYNQRELSILQARTNGFVEGAVSVAAGDWVNANTVLAHERVPEWSAAQANERTLEPEFPQLAAAAKQRLLALGMRATEVHQFERNKSIITTIPLNAEHSGVLLSVAVRPGMTLSTGQTLAEINGLEKVWVDVSLPQSSAGEFQPGDKVVIAVNDSTMTAVKAKILQILPAIDTATRTVTVRLEIPNPQHRLHPGQFVQVHLHKTVDTQHLLIPTEAIVQKGDQSFVFLEDGQHYQPVEVRTGRESAGFTEILAGLQAGDHVVLSGQYLLDSEATISGLPIRSLPAKDSLKKPMSMPGMEGM